MISAGSSSRDAHIARVNKRKEEPSSSTEALAHPNCIVSARSADKDQARKKKCTVINYCRQGGEKRVENEASHEEGEVNCVNENEDDIGGDDVLEQGSIHLERAEN